MAGTKYTEDESILALEIYMELPRKEIKASNPRIIGLSRFLIENGHPRNAISVKMKVENFKACDPLYPGITLTHYSEMDQQLWQRFSANGFVGLADAAEQARQRISSGRVTENSDYYLSEPDLGGLDPKAMKKVRVNQDIFQARVFEVYDSRCCITGMHHPSMLEACPIIPWSRLSDNSPERLDPRNGLCLNPIHHRAFDEGLFTIDEKYRIELSYKLGELEDREVLDTFYYPYEGKSIVAVNAEFLPLQDYLDYHRHYVFDNGR